jgi:cellulose synthase operon protein C
MTTVALNRNSSGFCAMTSAGKIKRIIPLLACLSLAACSSSEEKAQRYYDHGMQLLAQHEDVKAWLEFKNAVRYKKDFLLAWKALAQVDEAAHRWGELGGVLRTIIDQDPKDTDAKIKLARLMLFGGAPDEALKLVNTIDDASSNPTALALKSAIAFKLKDTATAVSLAQATLKLDPNSVDATMVLAAARLEAGDPNGALSLLNSGQLAQNNDLGVALFKIKIFEQLGNYPQIESQLQKLVTLYPKEQAFKKQLVKFYIDQHRPADADKELRAIFAADPSNTQAGLDIVRFVYATQNEAAGRAELDKLINAGGNVFPYQMFLAELNFAQGRFDDSFKLLQTLADDTSSSEHALAAKLKLAEFNLARKNTDAAQSIVAGILRDDSRNTGALRLRAIVEMNQGQLEPAISDLRAALNDQPRSTDLQVLLATAYERNGSIELADKQFADALRASNYDPTIGLNYVAFLRRRGNIQRAADLLTDLATRRPNNVAVLSALAEVKLALQDWVGAQQVGETIKRLGNATPLADQILGTAYAGQQKYDDSISAFQSAAVAAPNAVQPMASLVREFVQTKQTDRAVAFLQSVLNTNPSNAEALVLMGSVELSRNQPARAEADYKMAIQKQPKDAVGYRALSEFYARQKNYDGAVAVIQDGLNQQPDNSTLHMSLAGVYEQTGNYEGAIAEYQNVLKQQPGSLVALNNLASLLADHRSDKASLEQAQSLATSLNKTQVPQFKDTLGWVDYRSGDYASAVPLLEQAAKSLTDAPLVRYHLGMAYAATGQHSKATDEFKAALDKSSSNPALTEVIKNELKKSATQ